MIVAVPISPSLLPLPATSRARRTLAALPPAVEAALWRGDEFGSATTSVVASGWTVLDKELPGGGWPCQAVTEVLCPQPSVLEWRLAGPTLRGIVAQGGQVVVVGPPKRPHLAISNSRLLALDDRGVTFRWKDYRAKAGAKGQTRHKAMTLAPEEFMRRFLLHVLPSRFHRIRHYCLLANGRRKQCMAQVRGLLTPTVQDQAPTKADRDGDETAPVSKPPVFACRHCGQPLTILLTLARGGSIRAPPPRAGVP